MSNLLLLGGTGQVGFELQRSLAALGQVIAPTRSELDLTNESDVSHYINDNNPALIVNAAAWTAVDAAEGKRTEAERLNAHLPAQLAAYAKTRGIRLVHFSSDYVYSGDGDQPWVETSVTGALNRYGKTKLAGDLAVQKSSADHLIFRTSWVYSARGNNFMKTMLRLAATETELNVVADQAGAPTPARLIAEITALAIHNELETGLYHLAPRGETTWHGFAKEIFIQSIAQGKKLALQPEKVRPIPTSDYPTPAQRPLNSRLDTTKLEQALMITLPDWRTQLALTLDEYLYNSSLREEGQREG